jgi:predicted aminopeptidase
VLSSCYVTAQGSRYLAIRGRAVPAARALGDPRTPEDVRLLLERAAAARAFAVSVLGLRDTRSYRSIVTLEADRLATVVSACAELSFDRYLWRYPFVGRLPYRGYFDPADADAEAARLRKQGLDVLERPVDAFSTLGWLADPLFSFMASYDEAEVSELVIHEMTHATVFLRGRRAGAEQFNEELATFVGREGALEYLVSRYGAGSAEVDGARRDRADAEAFSTWLRGTAGELQEVYASDLAAEQKRARKAEVIAARAAAWKERSGELVASERYRAFPMERLNNAWLDLYRLYEGEPDLYRDYLEEVCGSSLARFVERVRELTRKRGDPKALMRRGTGAAP